MVLMVLDHVRDFYHSSALTISPTDIDQTTAALFFTRWITHLCAPVFVFLSGFSAYISLRLSANPRQARRKLWQRGMLLILLDWTVVNFGIWMDVQFSILLFNVLSAIGFAWVMLSWVSKWSNVTVLAAGILLLITYPFLTMGLQLLPANIGQFVQGFFAPIQIPFGADQVFLVGYGFRFGRPEAFEGWPLWGVYGAWVSFVILLYPLCYAYDQFKQKRRGKGITAWI